MNDINKSNNFGVEPIDKIYTDANNNLILECPDGFKVTFDKDSNLNFSAPFLRGSILVNTEGLYWISQEGWAMTLCGEICKEVFLAPYEWHKVLKYQDSISKFIQYVSREGYLYSKEKNLETIKNEEVKMDLSDFSISKVFKQVFNKKVSELKDCWISKIAIITEGVGKCDDVVTPISPSVIGLLYIYKNLVVFYTGKDEEAQCIEIPSRMTDKLDASEVDGFFDFHLPAVISILLVNAGIYSSSKEGFKSEELPFFSQPYIYSRHRNSLTFLDNTINFNNICCLSEHIYDICHKIECIALSYTKECRDHPYDDILDTIVEFSMDALRCPFLPNYYG